MTTIKVLPEGCLSNTSAKVCGDPAEFMDALASFISKHGVVEKRTPFSIRAKISWTFAVRVNREWQHLHGNDAEKRRRLGVPLSVANGGRGRRTDQQRRRSQERKRLG